MGEPRDRSASQGLTRKEILGLAVSGALVVALFAANRGRFGDAVALELALLAGAWTVLAGLAAGALRRGLLRGPLLPRDALLGLGLLLVALFLRAALATEGPGDLQMNMASALRSPPTDGRYGDGPGALMLLLLAALPRHLDTLLALSLVAGALVVPAAAALALALGRSRREAGFVALLVLLEPVLVRHAGEANRQALFALLCLLALIGAARYLAAGSLRAGAMAALASALAAATRPEATLLLGSLGAFALVQPGTRSRRLATLGVVGVLGLLAAGAGGLPTAHHHDLGVLLERFATALGTLPGASPLQGSPLVGILAALALPAALFASGRGLRGPALAALFVVPSLLAGLVWLAPLPSGGGPAFLTNARYTTLLRLLSAVLAAGALDWLLRRLRRRSLRLLLTTAVALSCLPGLFAATRPTSPDAELAFLREALAAMPAEAVPYALPPTGDVGLRGYARDLPTVFPGSPRWRTWGGAPEDEAPARRLLYLGASCHDAHLGEADRALCEQGRQRFGARPWREARLPNRPLGPEVYEGEEIVVGFYEMD